MAAHTPGPWLAAASASSVVGWPIVQPGTGRLICNINYVQRTAIDPNVAGDRAFNAESKANSRLIAAAPELLDALQQVMTEWREGYGLRCEDQVRAAIAKATGQSE